MTGSYPLHCEAGSMISGRVPVLAGSERRL
jgi:hypothetical protein